MSKRDPDDEALAMLGFESTTPNTQALITRIKALRELAEKASDGPWAEHGNVGCSCGLIFGSDGNSNICIVCGPEHLDSEGGPDCVPTADRQRANAAHISSHNPAAMIELYDAVLKVLDGL